MNQPVPTRRLESFRQTLDLPLLGRLTADRTTWNALDYLNLYRVFIALLMVTLFLTPLMDGVITGRDLQAARFITVFYLLASPALLIIGRRWQVRPLLQIALGLTFDLLATWLVVRLLGGVSSGAGVLLVGTMGAAGVLLPRRGALLYATLGTVMVLYQTVVNVAAGSEEINSLALGGMLGGVYFAITLLGNYLAQRTRETQAIAHQRSIDVANLTELNEVIIQRMRTGIAIVDHNENLFLANDAAWYLAGMPSQRAGKLGTIAPELSAEYDHWLQHNKHRDQPISVGSNVPAVVPRFARFSEDPMADVLVFLEDSSMVSRRAQEITLASLGRLSASIAHEIRNPLAAISHSAQLLDESEQLVPADKKLSGIISRQCGRLNEIIENVLQLARQEAAKPEQLDLATWLDEFVSEFYRHQDVANDTLTLEVDQAIPAALFDRGQLQQILWNLCQNALKYGRLAGESAQVTISGGTHDGSPVIEVIDRGPGVPQASRERLFQPFYTSSDDGTGLGLYLCRQLAAANAATLTCHDNPTGGCIFRLTLKISRPSQPGIQPNGNTEPTA